jgi:hypothetical protein
MELNNVPESCCKFITKKVFNFDRITEDFFIEIGIGKGNLLNSVDAIYFSIEKNELLLIEMKSFPEKIDENELKGKSKNQHCLDYVRKHLLSGISDKDSVRQKIIHSIFTIIKMIDYYKMDENYYSFLLNPNKLTIKNFFVLNISSEEYLFLELSNIDKVLKHRIEGAVDLLTCDGLSDKFDS